MASTPPIIGQRVGLVRRLPLRPSRASYGGHLHYLTGRYRYRRG
jgi:hypothetical protein